MRIVSVFFGAGIIFITYKILKELNLNIKWSILSATLVFLFIKDNFYIDYNYAILFITLLLIYIELKYKSYNIKYNILIGFLAGITILFKQSTGGCITFITVFYIILQRRNRTTLKAIMARFLGAIIPCILFIIYLIATNSVFSFIDYCILGIGTFENSVSYLKLLQGKDFYAFIALIVPISLLMLLIINLRNIKRKEINEKSDYLILFVYSIAQFIIVYPIADKIHFVIASVPTIIVILYYICKSIQNIRKIKVSIFIEHFMNVITISFVCILCLQAINEIYLYSTTEKSVLNHFANIPINQSLQNRILQIDEFINIEESTVYILDSEAAVYMIPLDIYNKDFDMFLKGNLGKASEEGQVEKIKNMKDTIILIKNDNTALNWQMPKEVINYVKNNLQKIGEISFFDIYKTD